MILNIFNLTVHPFLPQEYIKPQPIDDKVKFSLIYSDYLHINTRSSYNRENLYPFP